MKHKTVDLCGHADVKIIDGMTTYFSKRLIRMKIPYMLLLLFITLLPARAQRNEILSSRIASLQVVAGDNWMSPPVIMLNGEDPIHISFDDLTHEYHRYCYKLEHCEADWQPSTELFVSDFCEGFADGNTIDDLVESINTNTLYTHYSLTLPNSKCRMKISGNYRLTVYDENDENNIMFTACFMVVEPLMGVSLNVTTNTDIDINNAHQQVSMEVNYGPLKVTDMGTQIHTVVMQNGRWDDARLDAKPQFILGDGLRWNHCPDYIFNGGNEYRKFEMLDMNHTTMGLEKMTWDGNNYHAYIWPDEPRPSYVYDEDANGSFYIRNSDNIENDYASEYAYVHFTLKAPRADGEVFINGTWTNDRFLHEYQMTYNDETQRYEASVFLKQGYYSYQYLLLSTDRQAVPFPTEGNFFQTENSYQGLVYFKAIGQRTDRLVGYQHIKTR